MAAEVSSDQPERGGVHIVDMDKQAATCNIVDDATNYSTGRSDPEVDHQRHKKSISAKSWKTSLLLAYQTLGIVYGDLGTSSLYVFSPTGIDHPTQEDVLGILSLIFWGLTLIGLVKYALVVLYAHDQGEGGTLALYSLLSRHLRYPNNSSMGRSCSAAAAAAATPHEAAEGRDDRSGLKRWLQQSSRLRGLLVVLVMLGTAMVIGDGVLTPAISVLSAVQGIQSKDSNIATEVVLGVSAVILVLLFAFQKFGTAKVSFAFSPIMVAWFGSTTVIGAYNIFAYYPSVFKGLSPHYILHFFTQDQKQGWKMLGAVFLSLTGLEAMFADMGHFSRESIQIGFICVVYPSLVITYAGQAAYLVRNPDAMGDAFYSSTPDFFYWPMFVISTLASIVTSQAMITATFSIVKQSVLMGSFPRVKIVHTSKSQEGQVYCPEMNYTLLIMCLAILLGFRSQTQIANAYGVVVIWVMLITTFLMTIVMLVVWNLNIVIVLIFFCVFGFLECVFMVAAMNKLPQGGWAPFGISLILVFIMLSWHYGNQKKNSFQTTNSADPSSLATTMVNTNTSRPSGICFFFTEMASATDDGLPAVLLHLVKRTRSLQQITVLLSTKMVLAPTVELKDRVIIEKVCVRGVYRCIIQQGYKDKICLEDDEFVKEVIERLKTFVKQFSITETVCIRPACSVDQCHEYYKENIVFGSFSRRYDLEAFEEAELDNLTFIWGKVMLRAGIKAPWIEKLWINVLYNFLDRNCRSPISHFEFQGRNFLQVGMIASL